MFVICAERKIFRVNSSSYNSLYDILQIMCRTSFTDVDMQSPTYLLQCIFKGCRFMVGIHASHLIRAQLLVRQIRCMSVNCSVLKEIHLYKHALLCMNNSRIIHYLS